MFYDIIKTSILSLLIILFLHYIYEFFKTNLTTPKINDLIIRPNQTYQEINKVLSSESISLLPTIDINNPIKYDMKDELKNYLKTLSTK
jgi:hypothetical protein